MRDATAHTQFTVDGGLLLFFLDLVGLRFVLLQARIVGADDALGGLLGWDMISSLFLLVVVNVLTGVDAKRRRGGWLLTPNFLVFFATPILMIF